jgi:hypothetical protein
MILNIFLIIKKVTGIHSKKGKIKINMWQKAAWVLEERGQQDQSQSEGYS